MFGLFKLLSGGKWVYLVLALSIFAFGGVLGYQRGYQKGYSEVMELQHKFDEYRIEVLASVAKGNSQTLSKIDSLMGSMKTLERDFQLKKNEDLEFHNSLIKELYDANGKSCPLSPAIEHYLDRLRINQQSRRIN